MEVLIAVAIFTYGILAIASLQISSVHVNATAKMYTEAATRAANQMERQMRFSYDNLIDGNSTQGRYNIIWRVEGEDLDSDGTSDENIKNLKVIVSWMDRGKLRSKAFNFLKARDY